jgi:hypothetical protein
MRQDHDSRSHPNLRSTLTAMALVGVLTQTALAASAPVGRAPLAQTGCQVCIVGTPTVQGSGASGSFHVDRVENRGSTRLGTLGLSVGLNSTYPDFRVPWEDPYAGWGPAPYDYWIAGVFDIRPLRVGESYSNIDSGTITFWENDVPAGEYWMLLVLHEQSPSAFVYQDYVVMPDKVTCDGSTCRMPQSGSCSPDAYTACLIGGRYKVTSHWQNQYAGGQVSTLSATRLTDATAAFWLTGPDTYEYLIRINTATDNGMAWIAIPTFTDVEFWIAVTDTVRGQYYEYHSPAGNRTLIHDPYFFVYP